MRLLLPAVLVFVLFAGGAAIGRFVVMPLLHGGAPGAVAGGTDAASTPYRECLDEALGRRVDPVEARHTCHAIANSL